MIIRGKNIFVLLLCCMTISGLASCSSKYYVNDAEQAELVTSQVDTRDFVIEIRYAVTGRGRSIEITPNYYYLRIDGAVVNSYLPYFGRVYNPVPYGGGDGLMFSAPVQDYVMKVDKRGKREITFRTQTWEDSYFYTVEVWPNGRSYVNVNSLGRQNIRFEGSVNTEFDNELFNRTIPSRPNIGGRP